MSTEEHPVSTHTPTEKELQFAREILSGVPDDDLRVHYLVGVLRSQLGMTENSRDDVSAEHMVRNCRAAILAYDERR